MKRLASVLVLAGMLAGCGAAGSNVQAGDATATARATLATVAPTQTPYTVVVTATPGATATPAPTQTPVVVVVTATPLPTATATPVATAKTAVERSSNIASTSSSFSLSDPNQQYLLKLVSQGFGHGITLYGMYYQLESGKVASAEISSEATQEYAYAKSHWQDIGVAMENVTGPVACVARDELIAMDANKDTASGLVNAARSKIANVDATQNMAFAKAYADYSVSLDNFVQSEVGNLERGKALRSVYALFPHFLDAPFEGGKDVYATPGCS